MRVTQLGKLVVAGLLAQTFIWAEVSACHKKGHDCRVKTGRSHISDLPFRVAERRDFFAKQGTYPDIDFGQERDRLVSVLDRSSLVALASPLEVPRIATEDKDIRMIAVLQVRPSTFLVTKKAVADLQAFKGSKVGTGSAVDNAYARLAFSKAHVRPNVDIGIDFIQSPSERVSTLQREGISAAVLEAPSALAAQLKGLVATPMLRYVPILAHTFVIGRRDEMASEAKGLTAMLVALQAAVQWINNPEHRSAVISMLQEEYKIADKRIATLVYETLLTQRIYSSDLRVTPAVMKATDEWSAFVGTKQDWTLLETRYLSRK